MNEVLYELGKLSQGQKNMKEQITDGFDDMKGTLTAHSNEDDARFDRHNSRITKLEHAAVRIGVIAALISVTLTAVVYAASRVIIG